MGKKIAILILPGASVLCALEPLSMLGTTDQDWVRGEQVFVVVLAGVLFTSVALFWAKARWILAITVSSLVVFGLYEARRIFGTIYNGNYDGLLILVFLLLMGFCPFTAAVAVAVWGRRFLCQGRGDCPKSGSSQ
jgi:hypothetical protein